MFAPFDDPEVRRQVTQLVGWLAGVAGGGLALWERYKRVRRDDGKAVAERIALEKDISIEGRQQRLEENQFLRTLLLDLRQQSDAYLERYEKAVTDAERLRNERDELRAENQELHMRIDSLIQVLDRDTKATELKQQLANMPKHEDLETKTMRLDDSFEDFE